MMTNNYHSTNSFDKNARCFIFLLTMIHRVRYKNSEIQCLELRPEGTLGAFLLLSATTGSNHHGSLVDGTTQTHSAAHAA